MNLQQYQLSAIHALRQQGFDDEAIITIARIAKVEGKKALDHYLAQFLSAIDDVPVADLSAWIKADGM